jgi:hypothetical protein
VDLISVKKPTSADLETGYTFLAAAVAILLSPCSYRPWRVAEPLSNIVGFEKRFPWGSQMFEPPYVSLVQFAAIAAKAAIAV